MTKCTDERDRKSRTITTRSADITTLEELLEYSQVDLRVWRVKRHIVNSWEVTMGAGTSGSGKPRTFTNYQVKAWLERWEDESPALVVERYLEDIQNHTPRYPKKTPKVRNGRLAVLSVPDLHLGLLAWGRETGSLNYDSKIAERLFIAAVDYLLEAIKVYRISKILFVMGNDYFNSNSAANITYAGTPQHEDDRWQKTFTRGRRMAVEGTDRCLSLAPVDIIVVPGNHDYERAFFLGEVLDAWYRKCKNVDVDNSPLQRKYYAYGSVLLGLTHGKTPKLDKLPLIMADEASELWGAAAYREILTGHTHGDRATEIRGVRVRTLPSLCPVSAWAAEEGYRNMQEAQAHVWDPEYGKVATVHYHPPKELYEHE
jgi:predicted phosphodiesterase